MTRKKGLFFILVLIIVIILNSSLWYTLRSYVVMYLYSKIHENDSLLKKNNIQLKIPGGLFTKKKDWYPFVMVFNDNEGFSGYMGRDYSLTILYNFGHFIIRDGCSSYYAHDSKYYSSFYGGYLIKNNDDNEEHIFGFNDDGTVNLGEILSVPKYDQEQLVLASLGCPGKKMRFETTVDRIQYNVDYINFSDWVKIDSTIITNGPIHKYKEDLRAYIQYGKPAEKYCRGEDFPIISIKGRVYVKYFEKYKTTIFLYILAPDMNAIEECDRNILSKSLLK